MLSHQRKRELLFFDKVFKETGIDWVPLTYSDEIAEYIEINKETILRRWIKDVRAEFSAASEEPDPVIRDHVLEVLKNIQETLEACAWSKKPHNLNDCYIYKGAATGGHIHGKQRASVNAYSPQELYWEYVLLRRTLVAFLYENGMAELYRVELINGVIESACRESVASFTQAVQSIQQKLTGTLVHDLRSPLQLIDSTAQILSLKHSGEVKALADRQHRAAQRMNHMANEMLHVVAIEGGQGFDMEFKEKALLRTIEILWEDLQGTYGDRIKISVPDKEPEIAIDAAALTRTLENLVSNAFKYGFEDTDIMLTITDTERDVIISVHNEGCPIPESEQQSIFKFLKRIEGRKASKGKSWGMGLALAKAAAEGHKGDISVQSSEENGTTFTIRLPKGARKDGEKATIPF